MHQQCARRRRLALKYLTTALFGQNRKKQMFVSWIFYQRQLFEIGCISFWRNALNSHIWVENENAHYFTHMHIAYPRMRICISSYHTDKASGPMFQIVIWKVLVWIATCNLRREAPERSTSIFYMVKFTKFWNLNESWFWNFWRKKSEKKIKHTWTRQSIQGGHDGHGNQSKAEQKDTYLYR